MQEEAALAGLSQVFESISPEDLQKLRQAQEMIFRLSDEDLADASDVLDAALEDPEARAALQAEADLPLTEESLFLMNALIKSAMPQTEGYMPRQGMYDGGIASLGRGGDTMLAHITPGEAHLLRSRGGSGTINPRTGHPEFFFKAIGRAVKKTWDTVRPFAPAILAVALPGVGAIAGTLGTAGAAALGSGLGTLIAGGNPRQALTAAAGTFAGATVLGGVSNVMRGGEGGFMAGARGAISPEIARARIAEQTAARAQQLADTGKQPSLLDRIRYGETLDSEVQKQIGKSLEYDVFGNFNPLGPDGATQPPSARTGWQKTKDFFDPRSDWQGNRPPSLDEAYKLTSPNLPQELRIEEARRIAQGAPLWQRALPLAGAGLALAGATGGLDEKPAQDLGASDWDERQRNIIPDMLRRNPHALTPGFMYARSFARDGGAAYLAPSARKKMFDGGSRGGDMGMGHGAFSDMGNYGGGSDIGGSRGGDMGMGGGHFSDMGGGGDWGGHSSMGDFLSAEYGASSSSSSDNAAQELQTLREARAYREAQAAQAAQAAAAAIAAAEDAQKSNVLRDFYEGVKSSFSKDNRQQVKDALRGFPGAVGSMFTREGWRTAKPTFDLNDPNWYTDYFGGGDPSNLGGDSSLVRQMLDEIEAAPPIEEELLEDEEVMPLPVRFRQVTGAQAPEFVMPSTRQKMRDGGSGWSEAVNAVVAQISPLCADAYARLGAYPASVPACVNAVFRAEGMVQQANDARQAQEEADRLAQKEADNAAEIEDSRLGGEGGRVPQMHPDVNYSVSPSLELPKIVFDEAAERAQEAAAARQAQEEAVVRQAQEEAAARRAQKEAAVRQAQEEATRQAQKEAAARQVQEEATRQAQKEAAARRVQDQEAAARRIQEEAAERAQKAAVARQAQEESAAALPPVTRPDPILPPAITLPPSVTERELPPARPLPPPAAPVPSFTPAPSILQQPRPPAVPPVQPMPNSPTAFQGDDRFAPIPVANLGASFAAGQQQNSDFLQQLIQGEFGLPSQRIGLQMGGRTPDGLDLPFNNHQLPQTPYGPRIQGPVLGPQRPTDDNIAAALHPNEFVFTTEAVKGAGDGDVNRGIKAMYDLMHRLERRAGGRA